MSRTRGRLAGLLTALTLVLAPVLALGSAAPAQAATGTTYVTVCTARPPGTATPLVTSYWWNGTSWQQMQSARAGCVYFTLGHNGYWHFMASTYSIVGCAEYVYGWASPTYIKQNLPVSSSTTGQLVYQRMIPLC